MTGIKLDRASANIYRSTLRRWFWLQRGLTEQAAIPLMVVTKKKTGKHTHHENSHPSDHGSDLDGSGAGASAKSSVITSVRKALLRHQPGRLQMSSRSVSRVFKKPTVPNVPTSPSAKSPAPLQQVLLHISTGTSTLPQRLDALMQRQHGTHPDKPQTKHSASMCSCIRDAGTSTVTAAMRSCKIPWRHQCILSNLTSATGCTTRSPLNTSNSTCAGKASESDS